MNSNIPEYSETAVHPDRRRFLRTALTLAIAFSGDARKLLAEQTKEKAGKNPLEGAPFYVDPEAKPVEWAAELKGEDSRRMEKLGKVPTARWFGDWNEKSEVRSAMSEWIEKVKEAKSLPVCVLVNAEAKDYGQWIDEVCLALDDQKQTQVVVVLETYALSHDKCVEGIRQAVGKLGERKNCRLLLGVPMSLAQEQAIARLKQVGIRQAAGFVLNIADTQSVADAEARARILAREVGKTAVIDTSRAGGKGKLGPLPKVVTGDPAVAGYFWFKPPWESDQTGEPDLEYTKKLLKESGW